MRDKRSLNQIAVFDNLYRPYLYVYESSSELDELSAMNLASVRVEHDENIETMLEVSMHCGRSRFPPQSLRRRC